MHSGTVISTLRWEHETRKATSKETKRNKDTTKYLSNEKQTRKENVTNPHKTMTTKQGRTCQNTTIIQAQSAATKPQSGITEGQRSHLTTRKGDTLPGLICNPAIESSDELCFVSASCFCLPVFHPFDAGCLMSTGISMFDLLHHTMYNPCAILYSTQMKRLIATKRTKSCEKRHTSLQSANH